MRRDPVVSSNIASVGYDPGSRALEICFNNGRVYQYFGVPAHLHRALMSASSHGQFLNQQIKGSYRYARV